MRQSGTTRPRLRRREEEGWRRGRGSRAKAVAVARDAVDVAHVTTHDDGGGRRLEGNRYFAACETPASGGMRANSTSTRIVVVVEADADEEAAVAGEVELHDVASARSRRRQLNSARCQRDASPVNAFELLQRLARLRVPHIHFGVLPRLSAGSKRATSHVFSRISLRVRREHGNAPTAFNSGIIIGRAIATPIVRITHRGT